MPFSEPSELTEFMLRMPSGFDSIPTDDTDFFLMRASKPLLENIKKIKIGSCEVFEVCEIFEVPHPNFEEFEKFASLSFSSKTHIESVYFFIRLLLYVVNLLTLGIKNKFFLHSLKCRFTPLWVVNLPMLGIKNKFFLRSLKCRFSCLHIA